MPSAKVFHRELFLKNLTIRFTAVFQMDFAVKKEAMDDTVLFLDTHPCDKDALCYYNKLKKEREEAVNEYTQKYGPLSKYDVPDSCYWEWVKDPWPWE